MDHCKIFGLILLLPGTAGSAAGQLDDYYWRDDGHDAEALDSPAGLAEQCLADGHRDQRRRGRLFPRRRAGPGNEVVAGDAGRRPGRNAWLVVRYRAENLRTRAAPTTWST